LLYDGLLEFPRSRMYNENNRVHKDTTHRNRALIYTRSGHVVPRAYDPVTIGAVKFATPSQ